MPAGDPLLAKSSPRNLEQIRRAMPHAIDCRGFHQWLQAGRCVMKGQHGVAILAPRGGDESGDESRLKRVYVFDVSQTKPIERHQRADDGITLAA